MRDFLPVGRAVRPLDRDDARVRRGAPPPRAGRAPAPLADLRRLPASPAAPRGARVPEAARARPVRPLRRIAPPWLDNEWPSERIPGRGPRVAVVAGCVQSVVFGHVNRATARVLAADGYDVHVPWRAGVLRRAPRARRAPGRRRGTCAEAGTRPERLRRDRHERGGLRLASEGSRQRERRRRLGASRRGAGSCEARAARAPRRVPGLVPPEARAADRGAATRRLERDSGGRARRAARAGALLRQRRHLQHRAARRSAGARRPEGTANPRDRCRGVRERKPRVPRAGLGGTPAGGTAAADPSSDRDRRRLDPGVPADELLATARR